MNYEHELIFCKNRVHVKCDLAQHCSVLCKGEWGAMIDDANLSFLV